MLGHRRRLDRRYSDPYYGRVPSLDILPCWLMLRQFRLPKNKISSSNILIVLRSKFTFSNSFSRDFSNSKVRIFNNHWNWTDLKQHNKKKFLLFLSFFNILELTNSSFLGHVELRNTRNDSFTGGGWLIIRKKSGEKNGGNLENISDL